MGKQTGEMLMPARAKNPAVKREEFLAARPRRADGAVLERKNDGSALVKIPIKAKWPFRLPAGTVKTFELDEMGLYVWDLCDGETTLLDVIEKFAEKYRLSVRESEVAAVKFLEMLVARRLMRI
jgi:Coenzyme PQQ synthesis protein D (PqqD)